ncbi:hypothetical protein RQP46_003602 [Phenoliferia psychrophenolica]
MKLFIQSCVALAAATVAAAQSAPSLGSLPLPVNDPFYVPPSGWQQKANGAILRTRNVTIGFATVVAVPAVTGYQLLYRTNDAFGNPQTTVTTLMVPSNAVSDRVIIYANAENSNSINCAPSYLIQKGANTSSQTADGGEQATYEGALLQGWIVALPDHEGPNSAYAYGPQAGHAVLDSVRATLAFGPNVGLLPTAKVGLWGYSGGAIAMAWAEALIKTYGADLNIVGGAHGGTPASLQPCVELINGGVSSGLLFAALTGIASADPGFSESYYSLATPLMKSIIADTVANTCGGASDASNIDLFKDETYFTSGPATLGLPAWQAMFEKTKLGANVNASLTPPIPVHVYHARNDEVIPYTQVEDLVKGWCANGANLEFVLNTAPQVEHLAEAGVGFPAVLQFFADRFNGVAFPAGCAYKYDPAGADLPLITNSSVVNAPKAAGVALPHNVRRWD